MGHLYLPPLIVAREQSLRVPSRYCEIPSALTWLPQLRSRCWSKNGARWGKNAGGFKHAQRPMEALTPLFKCMAEGVHRLEKQEAEEE